MVLPSSPSSCGNHHLRLQALGPAGHLLPKLRFNFRRQGPQQDYASSYCWTPNMAIGDGDQTVREQLLIEQIGFNALAP